MKIQILVYKFCYSNISKNYMSKILSASLLRMCIESFLNIPKNVCLEQKSQSVELFPMSILGELSLQREERRVFGRGVFLSVHMIRTRDIHYGRCCNMGKGKKKGIQLIIRSWMQETNCCGPGRSVSWNCINSDKQSSSAFSKG